MLIRLVGRSRGSSNCETQYTVLYFLVQSRLHSDCRRFKSWLSILYGSSSRGLALHW